MIYTNNNKTSEVLYDSIKDIIIMYQDLMKYEDNMTKRIIDNKNITKYLGNYDDFSIERLLKK